MVCVCDGVDDDVVFDTDRIVVGMVGRRLVMVVVDHGLDTNALVREDKNMRVMSRTEPMCLLVDTVSTQDETAEDKDRPVMVGNKTTPNRPQRWDVNGFLGDSLLVRLLVCLAVLLWMD